MGRLRQRIISSRPPVLTDWESRPAPYKEYHKNLKINGWYREPYGDRCFVGVVYRNIVVIKHRGRRREDLITRTRAWLKENGFEKEEQNEC